MRILGSQPQGRAPQAFQVPVGSQPHSPEPEVEKANLGGGAVPTLDPQGIQPPANPGQVTLAPVAHTKTSVFGPIGATVKLF